MSFWMGMANALKDKKEEDFKRELLGREYLEKRRDNVLSVLQRRREQQAEIQQDLTDVYWARDYFSGAEDSESVQSLIDQMAANPAIATQIREKVTSLQEESGTRIDPNSVLLATTIHGVTGINPQNVFDINSVYTQTIEATSQEELDKAMTDLMSNPVSSPTTSVSFDPTLAAPENTKLFEEQEKAFDSALLSTMAIEQERAAAAGDTAKAAQISDMINNISDENVRIRATQQYGANAVQTMQEQFAGNPMLRGIERNTRIPWAVIRTESPQAAPAPQPTTQEEIDALPPGTQFIWLDGRTYTKD